MVDYLKKEKIVAGGIFFHFINNFSGNAFAKSRDKFSKSILILQQTCIQFANFNEYD